MKQAIVVDCYDSGLGIAAKSRADINSEIDVIAALDFRSSRALLQFLIDGNYHSVLFSWRYLLSELKQDHFHEKRLNFLKLSTLIGVLIPDYQGVDLNRMVIKKSELELLEYVNFFYVTNCDLAKIYEPAIQSGNFAGVFHDLPMLKNIREIRASGLEVNSHRVIWVGNSKWGSRHGYIDHKGFSRIVKPLQEILRTESSPYFLEVIDSANSKLDNLTVLKKIAESGYLILCSDSEGTGLPILEALGMGTKVISTNVGIAPELSTNSSVIAISSNSAESFYELLQSETLNAPREVVVSVFEEFVSHASAEKIDPGHSVNFSQNSLSASIWKAPFNRMVWILRFLKNL